MKKFAKLGAALVASTVAVSLTMAVAPSASAATCSKKTTVEMLGTIKTEIKDQFLAATKYEKDARSERGVTGTNAAAALFFLPGLLATYMNTEDAIKAARDRQDLLARMSTAKGCGPVL